MSLWSFVMSGTGSTGQSPKPKKELIGTGDGIEKDFPFTEEPYGAVTIHVGKIYMEDNYQIVNVAGTYKARFDTAPPENDEIWADYDYLA